MPDPAIFAPTGDGWAILAEPPGVRDLARPEYWLRSQDRADRRRAAQRRAMPLIGRRASLSTALIAAALAGPAAAGASAQVAAAGSQAPAAAGLSRGATGPQVRALQRALGIAADGVFGAQTQRAVRAFQQSHGLQASGAAGPLTLKALGLGAARRHGARVSAPAAAPPVSPAVVSAVQQALGVTVDGVLGPQTRAALQQFEAAHGLPVDGTIGAPVLQALGIAGAGPAAPADPSASPAPAPAPGAGVQQAVAAAMSKIGDPYSSGAAGPGAFDCSGLVMWAFSQAGISLPRTSFEQYGVGTPVTPDAIQSGDLVFFDTAGPGASDVGIATGPDTAVSATTHGVMTHPIHDGYWGAHFVGARQVG
jgi:peptidoglycan DL-endopeptidase CwlO